MGEMSFSLRDLYPNMGAAETSTDVQPDADDQQVLGEEQHAAVKADRKTAGTKYIFIGIGILIALVIFLGGE